VPKDSKADPNLDDVAREVARRVTRSVVEREAIRRATTLVARATSVLRTTERLSAVLGRIAISAGTIDPAIPELRATLNEVMAARRDLDLVLNEVLETADRVLDAFDAETRHILGEK
jgi:hypothetical protein